MSKPILLWDPARTTTSDDAGTTVVKSVLPSAPNSGLYEHYPPKTCRGRPPSLAYFCIRALLECPDQVHRLEGWKTCYTLPLDSPDNDIIHALVPHYNPLAVVDAHSSGEYTWDIFNWARTDPRLWAIIVQLFDNLPELFHTYIIALSDKHMPILQQIPSTSHFALITILNLSKSTELTDNTITQLKGLHTLCALDASLTQLTAHGINRLANTLTWADDTSGERRGPWGLRILKLQSCKNIRDDVITHLSNFPLLAVVDLRGTQVNRRTVKLEQAFGPCPYPSLYAPASFKEALEALATISAFQSVPFLKSASKTPPSKLFSSQTRPFILSVDTLHYPDKTQWLLPPQPAAVNRDNVFVVVAKRPPPEPRTSAISSWSLGNTLKQASITNGVQTGTTNSIHRWDEPTSCGPFHEPRPRSPSLRSWHGQEHSEGEEGRTASRENSDLASDIEGDNDIYLSDSDEQPVSLWQRVEAVSADSSRDLLQTAAAFYAAAPPQEVGSKSEAQTRIRPPPPPARPLVAKNLPEKSTDDGMPYVLYRPPPPWSRLDDLTREHLRTREQSRKPRGPLPEVAMKTGSVLAREGIRGVLGAISQRKKPESVMAPVKPIAKEGAVRRVSKNPFIKNLAPQPLLASRVESLISQPPATRQPLGSVLDPGLVAHTLVQAKKRPRLTTTTPLTCSQAFSSFVPNKPDLDKPSKLRLIANRMPTVASSAKASSSKRSVSGPATMVSSVDYSMKMKAISGRTPIIDDTLKALLITSRPSARSVSTSKTTSNATSDHTDTAASSRPPSPEPAYDKSTLTQPVRPHKPLKRISELRVPPLPESTVLEQRRVAEERTRAEMAAQNKPKGMKQTHLRLRTDSLQLSGIKTGSKLEESDKKLGKRISDTGGNI